jgi:hypothetical protein
MVVEDEDIVSCPACQYEYEAKLDNLTDEE